MMQVMANSGILSDDYLDGLRAKALQDYPSGLKKNIVAYIKALEKRIIDDTHSDKCESLNKIWEGWTEDSL